MSSAVRVAMAVGEGYSIVCATCTRFWEGREKRLAKCAARRACAGPFAGLAFPEYDGPIKNFAEWCFVCGERATHAVRHEKSRKNFGLCARHVQLAATLEPTNLVSAPMTHVMRDGQEIPVEALLPRNRKSLVQEILKVEAYFEDKRRDRNQD